MASVIATVLRDKAGVSLAIDFPGVTQVRVGRQDPSGFTTLIRYGEVVTLTGGKATIEDYELALDTSVTYVVTQVTPAGSATATSLPVTVPSDGESWLKDPAYPTMNVRIPIVTAIPQLTTPARSGLFPIIDRAAPVVVTTKRQSAVGELTLHTLTDQQRQALTDLLARGTVLLLQTPSRYAFGSRYVHVRDVVEQRLGLAMEPARMWTLPFTVVDRPEGLIYSPTNAKTWRAVRDIYPTWNDLSANGKTWAQLLEEGP